VGIAAMRQQLSPLGVVTNRFGGGARSAEKNK